MATDTTHLPQGELNTDAGNDMAGSELEFGAVQLAQVTTDGGQPVQLPQGQQTVLVPVQAGQTLTLPTDSPNGLIAKIGPEGNLAIVVDGRTIILQGYVQANEQSPVRLVTSDGDQIDVADVIAATDPSLDIQTAAGPASGNQGETPGSGIYTPFVAGPGLDGLEAVGVLDPTLLRYKLIDDNRRFFEREEDTDPTNIEITFDALGGVINEDDLLAVTEVPNDIRAALVIKDNGNDELGNDPFDNDGDNDKAGNTDNDGNPDFDREPLFSVATVKVDFGPDVPGTLSIDDSELPTGLTSEGEPIIYEVLPAGGGQGNGIVAFVDKNGDNKFDEGDGDRKIFDIKVQEDSSNSEFHVLFTLYDNIDNTAPDANGDGAADLLGADEQTLKLPVKVTAEDSDPQGSSLSAVMNLGVTDDRPFFGEQVVIGNELISVTPGDSSITHDESWFPQSDDGADDQSLFDPVAQDYGLKAGEKVLDAGFGLPYGDSVGSLIGIAQTQVLASFGADGRSQEVYEHKSTDTSARDSIFGALSDRADGTIDGLVNGVEGSENERPFELFMIEPGKGNVPLEDKLGTVANEGNLTIEDQATNATVTWNGAEPPLQVFLRQVDAQTIVGYVIPPEGEGNPQEARAFNLDGENGEEAVFVLTIDDNGVMTFVQFHQINHDVDGPTSDDHDDSFQIKGEDGTSLVHVRISDYDGDHATQPVDIAIQDDGPKFCGVDWGCDNDSKNGKGIIDEDKLNPNGNNDWAPGDDKGGKHADGKIEFNFGVDKPGHVEAHALTVKDSDNQTLLAVTFSYVEDEFGERTYTVDGDSDLKTADGHEIAIEASYDAGTGLLTLIGRDTEDGSEAFVYTLQTTGYDKGEFTFCLNEPLYHPYTDSDSENDGPGKSFEDDLKFDLTVRGYDADGDWADGSICINVDDDSPKAECDYECVVEGKDGETLHFATGNVVTGDGDTVFGNDGNNLDGNADNPGADQPYSISKLKHDGTQYFLNTPESGDPFVTKGAPAGEPGSQSLGAGEGFNPVTGILHIPTEQGGTLDIVLISDTLADVGDYKYTVPADADHDIDHHFGPEAADSASFGDLTAWQQSFSDHGITVSALGGSLVIKAPVNAVPETGAPSSYGGIGVNGGESDESEVDTDGNGSASEGLRLDISNSEFPGGVKNISLTLGALFDGTQYDSGNQEILQWEAWNGGFLVASGQILGDPDGLVTLDIDTLLPFDHIVLKPIDNGQDGESFANNSDFLLINAEICCPLDKFTEEFEYTLQDADGDESCATLKVDVKDTEPTHEHGQLFITTLVVDEDGLPKGVGNTDSPFDDSEDHSAPNAPVDDAKHFGTIPFTPGADPTSIELTVFGGPDTGMNTLDNQNIFAAWDAATQTLVGYIEGTNPLDPANQIFKMTVTNPLTGAYTFELLQAVKHENKDLGFLADDTENILNLPTSFIVVAEIEDKDCDVLFSKVVVTIDDDMPVITPCDDENGPINLLVNGSFEQLGTEDGGALDRGTWGVFSKIPGWTSGNGDDPSKAGLEIQADGAVPQIDAQDGEHYAELDSDALNKNEGKPGSTNASIYQDVDTQDGNNYVLSFSYSPREGNPATDGIEVWFDGQLVTTIDSGDVGKWTEYKFVVEAGEGDATPDSSRLEFKAVGTADSLGGFIDNVSLTACARVDEDDLVPNGIEGGPGDDGVDIGTVFDGSLGINFGADEGKSIVFSENGQPNLKSGNQTVKYEWVGAPGGLGTLIAYVGNDHTDPSKQVFKVEVTSLEDGGQYTFTLLKPLDHPDNDGVGGNDSKDNGTGSFEDNLIFQLNFKATDRDDDTVDGHLQINVDDDSPIIGNGEGSFSLATDETKGGGADVAGGGTRAENDETLVALPVSITGQVGLAAANAIGASSSSAAGLFTGAFGADQPGTAVYSLVITGGGATGLTDTATNTDIVLVAGPNNTVLGKANGGAGAVVFAFSIDGNTGQVTMAQYRAVNHGDDENAPGDHDEAVFFDSGVLGVNLKLTDFDKDAVNLTVDISGSISVDDDGPHATCDSDSVTEGAGNYATGNVVTGIDANLLDKDANLTDGNADNPGQDGPYTISKLAHDGDVYELSADGLSVTQNGGALVDGTFAGGKLTITTAEGATFEIIMVSPTQSEVGEYKYTPGPNPIHAEDVHVGPHTLADSLGGAFDTVTEWQTAFTNGGITLIPAGGALALKTVDVAGPDDYRGIGVDTGIDNGEVDTKSESLTLQFDAVKFPGGVNNAEVKLGAFFDGQQFDAGNQEILKWEVYDGAVLVASGQIVGDYDGVVTLDIDTPVNFDKIVLTPLNNGAGSDSGNNSDFLLLNVEVCKQEPVKEKFDYTLRDGDGDESTACLDICVEDTVPSIPTETPPLSILVDEDGLANGIGNTDSPFDADEGDAGDDDAKFSGNIPFTPGADPVTIELSVAGGDTGLETVDGDDVHAAWDAATSTLIGYVEGTDPSDPANQVFKMTVTDHTTGAFTFTLLQPVEHPNTDAGGANNNTENAQDLSFAVNVQIEDKDCDVAFTTVTVTIDDDMPVISVVDRPNFILAVDESLDSNSGTSGGDDVPGGGTTQEDDEDHFTMPWPLNTLTTIGEAQANAANLFSVDYGADGPSGDVDYSLIIKNGGVTGLFDTQSGQPITLSYLIGDSDVVVGWNTSGNAVFAFQINPDTGQISMAQYRAVNHGATEPAPGEHDEVIGFLYDALAVKLEVSDADQDVVSLERSISQAITFDDDGPHADIEKKHDNEVIHDETAGLQDDDQSNAGLPGVFTAAGLIGWARSDDPVITTSNSSYGTDGAGTTVLSLKVAAPGVDSGLDDTATGSNILLVQNGAIVEGRVQGTNELVFAISLNQNGTIDVAQYRAIEHPDDDNHDEDIGIDSSALQAWVTITDKDGDSDTDSVDIGSRVRFDDDGPDAKLALASGAQIVLDESADPAAADGYLDPNSNDEDGNVANDIAYAKVSGAALFVDTSVFGQDGPGTKSYSLNVAGAGSSNISGLSDSETNQAIHLVQIDADTVVGRVGGPGGTEAFRIDINTANGEVTVTQSRAVEHDNAGSSQSDHDESGSPEIMDSNRLLLEVTVTDGDKDSDTASIDLGKLIKFEDDGPIARNDIDALDAAAGNTFESKGNVITGVGVTTPGLDDGGTDTPWTISGLVGLKSSDGNPSGGFNVNGTYGSLAMNTAGQYTYNFDEANTGKVPSGSTEVFAYTLKDSDGDTDTATLTINLGEASVTTSALVNPQGGGVLKEDVQSPIGLTATPGTAGDRVTQIVLDDIPTGWSIDQAGITLSSGTLGAVTLVGDTLTININGAAPGVAVTATVPVTAAADSDVDGDNLVVRATVVDGVVFANGNSTFDVVVDAVLDQYLDVTAGAIAPIVEPVAAVAVNLNLSSGFAGGAGNPFLNSFAGGAGADGDTSEAVNLTAKITVTGDVAQLQLAAPIAGVTLTETATPGVWELTANTLANLQTALTQMQALVPAGFIGVVNGSVEVTTAEANTPLVTPGTVVPGSGVENDTGDNTYTDTTSFSIVVEDGVKTPTVGVNFTAPSLVIKEDSSAFFIVTANVPDATDKISKLNFTGLEALILDGWGVVVTPEAPTTGSYLAGEFNVTSVGQTAQVRVTLTPPADSDRDVINDILADITVTATAQDISTPALTATTAPLTVDVDVDAVLDQYVAVQTTASPTVSESGVQQNVNLNLAATINPGLFALSGAGGPDGDGSETRPVSAQITLSNAAVDLTLGAGFPLGTTLVETAPNSGIWILTATNAANLQSAVTFVEAIIPAGFNGAVGVDVKVFTEEANTPASTPDSEVADSGQEHDNTDNAITAIGFFTLTVDNSARNSISGEVCFAEDTVFNQYDQSLAQTSAPGQILHANVVTLGVDESLTALTITGIPAGASLTINGAAVTNGVALTAQQLADWKGGIPILVFPFDDSDVDFTLTFNGSTTDGSSNAVSPISGTVAVLVDAAADDPTSVTIDVVSSSGDEQFVQNETGTATITATFGDLTDGTETHTLTITAPAGFTFPSVANLDGILIGNVSGLGTGTVTVTVPAGDAGVSNFVLNVQAPANFAGTPTFQVEAKAVDAPTDLGCGPLDADDVTNNEATQTASDDVTFQANKLPIAYDDKKCGDEAAPKNVNLLLIFDNSGSMDADSGLPGGGVSKLEAAQQAAINMLNAFAATGGDVRVMLVTFNSDADREGTWLNLADAIDAINGIPQSGSTTNYEAAILDAISGFNDTDGRGDFATHDNLVYFLSDGEPTTGGNSGDNSITNGTLTSWDNLLENPANQIEHVYAVGLGTGIPGGASNPNLLDVANPVNNGVTETPNTVVLVDDFNDLSATLTGTVGTLNEGNVLDGSIENNDPQGPNPGPNNDPDNVGDGFSHVSFFEYNHPSLNGLDIQITWDGSGAVQPGEVSGGTNTVINGTKVSFDTEYGRMTFDVSNGDYDFIAGAIDNGDKEEHFTYKINDSNGDTSNPADLTVCIKDVYVDQTPITYDDVASGSEPAAQNVNLLLVFDNSGSMADPSGIPGVSKLQAAKQAAINLLNAYAATGGDVRVMLVTFNSNSDRQETWLSLAAAIDAIDDIPQSNSNTNYEAAIQDAIDGFNDTDGRGDFATHDNLVYFLSDGEPTTGGNSGDNSITDGTLTQWDNLLENPANQIDHVYAVGLGTGIPNGASNPNLLDVAQPDGNNNPVNTVVLVDDLTDLSATLTGTIGTPIEGNILDGTNESDPDAPAANTPDFQGDGPAHLSYFEYDSANNDLDIKITWDGSGAVDVDGTANGKATVVNGKEVSFDTDHGRMTIDFTDGDFKLMPATISGGDKTEVFNYKITDSDGDVSNQSKLSVIIDNLPPVVTIGDTTVNEGGVANIQVNLSEAAGIGGVTVNYTFQTKAGNTATGGGTDYNTVTSSIFIAAGASSGLISVNAVADAFFEGNETYSVVITSVTGGYTIADDTGLVTINDKTTLTVPTVQAIEQDPSGWPNGSPSGSGFDDDADTKTGDDKEQNWDGEGGDDTLSGAGGDDRLFGGSGKDTLNGGNDDDLLQGSTGNDTLNGDAGNDRLEGGDDDDTLNGGAGDDLLLGGEDDDKLFGGDNNDELFGGNGDDELHGGAGNDYLHGEDDGNLDKLFGDAGDDWLDVDSSDLGAGRQIDGGTGNDVLDISGFDLTGSTGITNIEIVNMEGSGNNDDLSLSAADVVAMTDADNALFVWGDGSGGADDDVALTGGGWSQSGTNVAGSDGRTYNIFQNGAANVFVDTDVDVALS